MLGLCFKDAHSKLILINLLCKQSALEYLKTCIICSWWILSSSGLVGPLLEISIPQNILVTDEYDQQHY